MRKKKNWRYAIYVIYDKVCCYFSTLIYFLEGGCSCEPMVPLASSNTPATRHAAFENEKRLTSSVARTLLSFFFFNSFTYTCSLYSTRLRCRWVKRRFSHSSNDDIILLTGAFNISSPSIFTNYLISIIKMFWCIVHTL